MPRFLHSPLVSRPGEPNFALLVLITMTGTLAMHVFVPALADAARDLHATPSGAQLTMTLFLVGLAGGQLVYGPMSDRYGRRPVLLFSLALYLVGLLVAIPAQSLGMLTVARLLQSLGGCGSLVLGRAMVRDVSTSEDAARKIAVLTMTMALTPALAPVLGGYINFWLGWRAIFGCLAVLVAVLGVVVLLRLPETNRETSSLPGGTAVLSGYMRLLRSAKFRNYLVAGSCAGTSLYAFLAVAPFLLVDGLGQRPQDVGLYCLLVLVGIVAGASTARLISRRIDPRRAARLGNFVSIGAAATLAVIDLSGHLTVISLLVPLSVYAAGVGVAGPNAVAGLMNVDPRAAGSASSLYGFFQMMFGAVFTLGVALWHGATALPVALTLLAASLLAMLALNRV